MKVCMCVCVRVCVCMCVQLHVQVKSNQWYVRAMRAAFLLYFAYMRTHRTWIVAIWASSYSVCINNIYNKFSFFLICILHVCSTSHTAHIIYVCMCVCVSVERTYMQKRNVAVKFDLLPVVTVNM